jgi:hypothetical protein
MLKQEICELVGKSISDKQYVEELIFTIPDKTITRVLAILHLNMSDYVCVIRSHEVRHVYKGHPDDIQFICEIPEIIQKFDKVRKNITQDRKTGKNLVNLEFYKRYNNNTVKLVNLKIHKDKKLELKTLFVV